MPSVKQAVSFGQNPYRYLAECRAAYGDVFTLQLPRDPVRVVACAPQDVKAIFALKADEFRSDEISLHLNLGDQSVLFADGERHRRKRQILAPPMHIAKLRTYAAAMLRRTDDHLDALQLDAPCTAFDLFRSITLDVILETVFGVDPTSTKGRSMTAHLVEWLETALTPGMFALSLAMRGTVLRRVLERRTERAGQGDYGRGSSLPWRKVARAKADLLALLRADVARCRSEGSRGRTDVLALLVDARYEDGEPMGEDDILDQLVTMLVGGFETTTNTLVWALFHILRNPAALAGIQAELAKTFGTEGLDENRCAELTYLDACIRESMRLSPISIAPTRELTKPMSLSGHEIPAGTIVWPCIYLAQRRAETWPDPERFDPQRFLGKHAPKSNVFFPYGGGRRRCIGATYAQFEMRIVMARLFERCEFELLTHEPSPEMVGLTVSPQDNLRVRLCARA